MAVIYVDEVHGSDSSDTPRGSDALPFRTLSQAYLQHSPEDEYKVKKADEDEYKPAAKSALKKAANYAAQQQKKATNAANREAAEEAAQQAALAQAKAIKIEEDPSLPAARLISLGETDPEIIGKLRESNDDTGVVRVKVQGRVTRVAKQGGLIFVTLRRGHHLMQCLLAGQLSKTYDALVLQRETSMEIIGELWKVPEGYHAPLDRELHADYFTIIAAAPGGQEAFTTRVPEDFNAPLELRHLSLRHEKPAAVMHVRSILEKAFNATYDNLGLKKVSPPALVQTQVEGGSTLFKLGYFNDVAFLSQSNQLYLESVLPVLGDVYTIEKSFRAEKSLTRRHLSEYTHIEAELDFITFDTLLSHIEQLICQVVDIALEDPVAAESIKKYNPNFQKPVRPFLRMRYSDAIDWLREHDIKTDEGKDHVFGDDIAEAAERRMTDEINRPIFLTHFPAEIKAFYMQRAADDDRVTESVDLLMPNVGEVVGGSMRIWDHDALLAAFKREGIDPTGYFWYLDQRKYGSSPHGGYGLGFERFLAWLMGLFTVREAILYPRFMGKCAP
ncbi:hypothetical protein F5884DRAFT_670253 [Xylogone sp. PMI_703]|nr:hypothetical protein F5884DRAFT_670253 [Xylogone sp. PMI_703]